MSSPECTRCGETCPRVKSYLQQPVRTGKPKEEDALNKRRREKAALRAGGLEHAEASVRAINAEPWEPMPGMVKRQCPECRYFFASLPAAEDPRCPDCTSKNTSEPTLSN